MKLINKDIVIGELNDWRDNIEKGIITLSGRQRADAAFKYEILGRVRDFIDSIDSLEVKEVDLEESSRHYLLHEHISPLNEVLHQADLKAEMQYHKDIENAYKAGFELGLITQKAE